MQDERGTPATERHGGDVPYGGDHELVGAVGHERRAEQRDDLSRWQVLAAWPGWLPCLGRIGVRRSRTRSGSAVQAGRSDTSLGRRLHRLRLGGVFRHGVQRGGVIQSGVGRSGIDDHDRVGHARGIKGRARNAVLNGGLSGLGGQNRRVQGVENRE